MATLRDLKGRIGSVSSSEKITGAMKMISSAKMNKAVREVRRLQPFRGCLEAIISHLLEADADCVSPLVTVREVKHVTLVVAGSDDGLCGAYNINIFKDLLAHINNLRQTFGNELKIKLLPVGNKMVKAVSKLSGGNISAERPEGIDSKSDADAVKLFTKRLEVDFTSGATDRVDLVYMGFISPSRQRICLEQLLPVNPPKADTDGEKSSGEQSVYIFEPSATAIFTSALPLMVLSNVQEAFCENRASEQAARVMAMQSANDNASKLLEQLHIEYNKLRQQSITNELLDILGGQVR